MGAILSNLPRAVILGAVLALIVIYFAISGGMPAGFPSLIFRYLHVISGVMWIGLLWYFNFVQIPNMPKIPAEQKPAVTKVIAPAALFWFRWAALSTIVTGLIVSILQDYVHQALSLGFSGPGAEGFRIIGIGMWLGTIMFLNVWLIIWPNQKKALGIVQVDADTAAKAGRTAMLASRTNLVLSVPMLFCMVAQQNLG